MISIIRDDLPLRAVVDADAGSLTLRNDLPREHKVVRARGPGAVLAALDQATARAGGRRQPWATASTIQGTPKRSTHMPNSSPHICFSNGMVT
jgi:hypothetical protein